MDSMMVGVNDIGAHITTLTHPPDLGFIEIVILCQKFLVDPHNISCLQDIQGWLLPSPPLAPH